MNTSLRVLLALSIAAPLQAGVAATAGQGRDSLDKVSALAQEAQSSASLEHAGQALSRGYEAASAPAPTPADGTAVNPPELQPAPPEPGAHFTTIPQPPIGEDKEDLSAKKAAEEAAAKKKDLQRMALGGAGGAIVFAIIGFIFGGPLGALAGAALGFGALAGVTYLNNHPIE
ncbi:MAG: hypothetical protein HY928_06550 [Elusimicrobia bacterium]|nr:hypothetical protein [Elusimicrobiota bacterium]